MTKNVFTPITKPGIQRDGTRFDSFTYVDGQWVRFQRARPRKILGYSEITPNLAGPSRGIFVNPNNGYTQIFNGYSDGMQVVPINSAGVGTGINDFTLSNFTASANNLWQFDAEYNTNGSGQENLLAHPGQNLADLTSTTNTPVLIGDINGYSMSAIGVFTATVDTTNGSTAAVLNPLSTLVGPGQSISGPGIVAGTTVVSVVGTAVVLSVAATATATPATLTFSNNISVSGGVVVLHPYIFVYGNNGLIQNCAAGNPDDWVSTDSNATNVASTKIVKGLPVRGGSNAPSGLFWALDSLIRVSYTPTTVTIGTVSSTFYWRYDIISGQSSILSSQCVIEYDGIYYWIGSDRFLLYNGVVKEIPNDMNQNYFFDNLNYAQRQKVYATKVSRYGEIWWFFPSGSSTECNDCIIYNVREATWYDAGQAAGSQRSAGFFSQVFHYPINASWNINNVGGVNALTITAGSSYTNGTFTNQTMTGGTGGYAVATIVVSGGVVTAVTMTTHGYGYTVGDVLTASLAGGSGFYITVTSLMNYVSLFQHEIGTDAVQNGRSTAILSFFETNNLGYVTGGPSQVALMSETNKWLRLERIEPDFVMTGTMSLVVTGKPYAQGTNADSSPYTFDSTTTKIDMKEQRRELRLRFTSNQVGGNYQLGRLILDADFGDVRGYSS